MATIGVVQPFARTVTLVILCVCSFTAVAIVVAFERRFLDLPGLGGTPTFGIAFVDRWFAARAWSAGELVALLYPTVVLPVLATIFHKIDARWHGGGIKDRIDAITKPHSRLTPDVIASTMTKQSILAAIAAIFIANEEAVGSIGAVEFQKFARALSRIGFSAALLLLVVSVLCYDYANRFKLSEDEKYELVRKGLHLDIFSWYVLISAYIVSMAAQHVITSVAVSIGTGFLVWWYYFVHTHAERAAAPPRQGWIALVLSRWQSKAKEAGAHAQGPVPNPEFQDIPQAASPADGVITSTGSSSPPSS